MNQAELKLVAAAQGGDRQAFGQLVHRFKGRVYAMSLAIAGDPDEAHELAQETFVRALQSLPRLEDPAKFAGWLRGITSTLGKDVRRRAARERRHLQAAARQREGASEAADAQLARREALGHEQAALAELVDALPENTRLALDLRFREGLGYAQIGELMGVPASTVRGLLYRGTKALRLGMRPLLGREGGAR